MPSTPHAVAQRPVRPGWPDARWLPLLVAAALLAGAQAQAAKPSKARLLEGQVVKVIDGDSLVFQAGPDRKGKVPAPLEVRLVGIDAPEGCQPWGPQAREALDDHVRARSVQLHTHGLDSYKRTLAVLRVDGVDINQRLVADGHAWSTRFKWNQGPYVEKERVAKALKRGLHATPGAVLPADFRRQHGRCSGRPSAPASNAEPG